MLGDLAGQPYTKLVKVCCRYGFLVTGQKVTGQIGGQYKYACNFTMCLCTTRGSLLRVDLQCGSIWQGLEGLKDGMSPEGSGLCQRPRMISAHGTGCMLARSEIER